MLKDPSQPPLRKKPARETWLCFVERHQQSMVGLRLPFCSPCCWERTQGSSGSLHLHRQTPCGATLAPQLLQEKTSVLHCLAAVFGRFCRSLSVVVLCGFCFVLVLVLVCFVLGLMYAKHRIMSFLTPLKNSRHRLVWGLCNLHDCIQRVQGSV